MNNQYFPAAPMSLLIKISTGVSYGVMLMLLGAGLVSEPKDHLLWPIFMIAMPIAFMSTSPFFMVRGYWLDSSQLKIQRFGWQSTMDLSGLRDFYADRDAMMGAIRLCGNGGLFCFAGYFRSKKLGNFRPFLTNMTSCVVLRAARKTIVVSPENPDALIAALTDHFGAPAVKADPEIVGSI